MKPCSAILLPSFSALWRSTAGIAARARLAILLALSTACAPGIAAAAEPAFTFWSENADSSELPKSHVEEISNARHEYTVVQAGTMDGRNCRSPMGCGIAREGALIQSWESNRSLRLENIGDTDVINPWVSNGRNNFRTIKEIVSAAVQPAMSDADKAFALWFQEISFRHHEGGDNNELLDPVKLFNVYGYNTCGNDSISLATLWRAAGLRVAPARALGHCVSQAFYDNRWHFFDGDMHSVYLLRDGETVAGEQDIVHDHDLVKRDHSKGILMPDTWWDGQGMCAMYFDQNPVTGWRGSDSGASMEMRLRPGEALTWRWGRLNPLKYHGALGNTLVYPALVDNGLWEYRPNLAGELWRSGAALAENIASGPDGLGAEPGHDGVVIWKMRSPYVFVGGRLETEGAGAQFFLSADGKSWRLIKGSLDSFFPTVGPALYEYQLKCEIHGDARLRRLAIFYDLQMAPLAMPEMVVGENRFTYTDSSTGGRKVRVSHQWVERSSSTPPTAPDAPLYPRDHGESDGTAFAFKWAPPGGQETERVCDYQFELSARADMRWPLSMSFYKLISRTADASNEKIPGAEKPVLVVHPRYTLPQPGLLAPDKTYYWHVRAMNAQGVWGDWSKTWSFTVRGPSHPLDVTLDFDASRQSGLLRWKADPRGRSPVKYRVYASDEKGFTISDQNYQGTVGVTKDEMAAWNPWFPANFVAETSSPELEVLGPAVRFPAANKAFYRVVAVDDRGNRSGPSDYAEAPRPVIFSSPVATANVGREYRYAVLANRSLGDLGARLKGGDQVSGYFDIEKPKFTIEKGPAWLKIEPATGLLSGVPDTTGAAEVSIKATLDREIRTLDEKALIWGVEKVDSTGIAQVGAATQTFTLHVQP